MHWRDWGAGACVVCCEPWGSGLALGVCAGMGRVTGSFWAGVCRMVAGASVVCGWMRGRVGAWVGCGGQRWAPMWALSDAGRAGWARCGSGCVRSDG